MVTKELSNIVSTQPTGNSSAIDILEFGCGDGFQIPYLKSLGHVIATDIDPKENIKQSQDIEFVQCEIQKTPFDNEQFDVIFSNHVIEHIYDLKNAFTELQRIGKRSCIYAFSVPTNVWLLLSVPAQYRQKIRLVKELLLRPTDNEIVKKCQGLTPQNKRHKSHSKAAKLIRFLLPGSHGTSADFVKCYQRFRVANWRKLFSDNGFVILKTQPLLLYGPSEWPIIPTQNSKHNLYSSVLFLMQKDADTAVKEGRSVRPPAEINSTGHYPK